MIKKYGVSEKDDRQRRSGGDEEMGLVEDK